MKNTDRATAPLRTVLIAGGAGGMGRAIALRMSAAGDRVALADLPGAPLQAAVAAVLEQGGQAIGIPLDIRDPAQCAAAVMAAAGWNDGLDVLVNAAGVWLEGASQEVTPEQWDQVLGVNPKGAFFVMRHAIPHLSRRRGVIVNIASDAGLVGNAGAAVYCASKGGLVLLSKALALELAPRGVRVNVVCPGDVATPMIEHQASRYGNGDPQGYKQRLLDHYPQGAAARFIEADEIARFVQFLCEPGAAPITGAALSIDFGVTAGY
jgi:NAD(P)-dependent dehydrogenase (short-subunit alcohol dehydrogenase family)